MIFHLTNVRILVVENDKLQVTLVQPNFQTGPKHLNSFYLPYSLGMLWAHAIQDSVVENNFEINNWVFWRQTVEFDLQTSLNSDIAFFSLYVWNKNFCYSFAKQLKQLNPNIKIVMGGPQVEWKNKNYFEDHPYVDSIVIGEGETAFVEILHTLVDGKPLKQRYTTERYKEVENLPSPYLTGLFDSLINAHPDITWTPTLETDRGCPYQCTFCDWGSVTASKVYKFYFDRIEKEIEWFGKNKVDYLHMTTANFGIFKERDLKIAKIIANTKIKYGYPNGITVSFAKNSNADVLEIIEVLQEANIKTGFVVSLQTMSDNVLENIKRKNMSINNLQSLKDLSDQKNIYLITELILGLPGETYESWVSSMEKTMQSGIMVLEVIYLQLIENAEMNVSQREEYDLKTFNSYDFFYDLAEGEDLQKELKLGYAEDIDVIMSTSTMPTKDMIEASLLSWFIFGTFSLGITFHISKYLNRHHNVTYTDFHSAFYKYCIEHLTDFKQYITLYKDLHHEWHKTGYIKNLFKGIKVAGWNIVTSLPIILHNQNQINEIINCLENFVKDTYDISEEVIYDNTLLTTHFCKTFNNYIKEPIVLDLKSNLLPTKKVLIKDRYNDFPIDIKEFMEQVRYARRKSWLLNSITALD